MLTPESSGRSLAWEWPAEIAEVRTLIVRLECADKVFSWLSEQRCQWLMIRKPVAATRLVSLWEDLLMPEAHESIRASVVVCVYTEKRLSQIRAALDSISRQTVPPWQVIVVVDHNPALYDLLAAEYPDHEVISNKFERGLSGARNTGIEQAAGDVVVFLDDDARAQPQWLETLLASYDDASVLGVGGVVLPDWSSPGRPAWLPEEFLWVVGCSYRGQPEVRAEVRNPIGANMSFRRSAFERAGFFNSSVGRTALSSRPLGCEETEFSIRLRRLSPGATDHL